jgi:hypothetical protein
MSDQVNERPVGLTLEDPRGAYEPPSIETVLTADEMAREVLFAGAFGSDDAPG